MSKIFTDKIGIIGTGNVAWHFARLFSQADVSISGILVRSIKRASSKGFEQQFGASLEDNLDSLISRSDLLIIAVNDEHIAEVAKNCRDFDGLVCHTSGSVSLELLSGLCKNSGVFYPFQTLSRGIEIPPSGIPICIEATKPEDARKLLLLASTIGTPAAKVDSEQRLMLHISAVLASNFTNHLMVLAKQLLDQNALDFSLLRPLMRETIRKAFSMDPSLAQTGPAKRADLETIRKHIEVLEDKPEILSVYRKLSDSIINLENSNH